jgi:hypothetical protein
MPGMSYLTYKFLHLSGILVVLMSLGGLVAGRLAAGSEDFPWRRHLTALHGIGLVVALVAGFGLLVRLQVPWPWPHWVLLKMVIWLWVGAVPVMARRMPARASIWWWSALAAALLAAFLAGYKPF